MNRALLLLMAGAVMAAGCGSQDASREDAAAVEDILRISVEELVTEPTRFGDRMVAVRGVLDHMCRTSGDKLRIKDESGLSVQVLLGEMANQFNVDMEGSLLAVTGVFKFEVTNKDELGEAQHLHVEDEDHECESEVAAMEALMERGIDPSIRTMILMRGFELL